MYLIKVVFSRTCLEPLVLFVLYCLYRLHWTLLWKGGRGKHRWQSISPNLWWKIHHSPTVLHQLFCWKGNNEQIFIQTISTGIQTRKIARHEFKFCICILHVLLAPSGALLVIMVYYIPSSAAPTLPFFSNSSDSKVRVKVKGPNMCYIFEKHGIQGYRIWHSCVSNVKYTNTRLHKYANTQIQIA